MKALKIHAVLLLMSFNTFAQSIAWDKLFSTNSGTRYELINAIKTIDGNIVAITTSATPSNDSVRIIKYDLSGNIIWNKFVGLFSNFSGRDIVQLKNQNFIFGALNTNSSNLILRECSLIGDTLSKFDYGNKNTPYSYNIIESANGSILASIDFQNNAQIGFLKTNNLGDSLFTRAYNIYAYGTSILINHKGNYVLSSTALDFGTSIWHPFFIEVTPDGDSISGKQVIAKDTLFDEEMTINPLIETSDHNYVFSARPDTVSGRFGSLTLMDSAFNKKWTVVLRPSITNYYYAAQPIELADSSFVVSLSYANPDSIFDIYHIGKTGNILNKQTFISAICNDIILHRWFLLNDSSAVLSGNCNNGYDGYIVKTDKIGVPQVIDTCQTFIASFIAQQNGDSLQLINTSNGGYDYAQQSVWKFADSTGSNIFNSKIKIPFAVDSVWARLTATNGYGCIGIVAKKVKVSQVTAVNQNSVSYSSLSVTVFPNPFTETTIFKVNNNSNSSYQLSIINSLGEEISSYNFSGKEFTLNASGFSSGLYMYVLRDGEGKMKSGKLVVE
jgi:hypothetical protein